MSRYIRSLEVLAAGPIGTETAILTDVAHIMPPPHLFLGIDLAGTPDKTAVACMIQGKMTTYFSDPRLIRRFLYGARPSRGFARHVRRRKALERR